ncbi:MAG: xylulokinase [Planctomycetota bacterium]|nr:xylulokinase [Planctomycetota bacterium]
MSYFLGVDIGTTGTRTLVINEQGKILGESSSGYPLSHPHPMWAEQNPDHWWKATVKTIRAAVNRAGINGKEVRAIGLSGQMHGSVFLDKDDQIIRPALLWNDQRTAAECCEIEEAAGGRSRLIKMVANPALTGFTAPKILWLRNHEPRNFDRLKKVLLPKDDIRRRLTGEYATDVSDASGMLLLDVAKRQWSGALMGRLGLDSDLFAKVYESEDVTATVTRTVARKLGLSPDCVVVGGAGDCAANAIGTGVVRSGVVSTSIGTSGVMFVHSDAMEVDKAGRLHTFCHAVRGKWHMMGVNLCAGGSLQWFADNLAKELGSKVFETVTREAAAVKAGSEGLFFLPYLAGERTPHADPYARGCMVGLTLAHTRGHIVRAIMEGVTYSMRDSLEIIQSMGVPTRQIRVSGGGAKSKLWRQMQADVFGKKTVTINAEQGPAYGVALLGAVGAGAYRNIQQACQATIREKTATAVNRKTKAIYDARFPVYQDLYRSLKNDFRNIAVVESR